MAQFFRGAITQSCSLRGDIWLGGKRKARGRSLASSSGGMNRRLMEVNLPDRAGQETNKGREVMGELGQSGGHGSQLLR